MWRTIGDIVGNVCTEDMGNIPTPRHHFETPDVTAPQKARQGEAGRGKAMRGHFTILRSKSRVEKINLPWQPARCHHLVPETVQ